LAGVAGKRKKSKKPESPFSFPFSRRSVPLGQILLDEAVAKGEALEEVGGLSLSFNTVLARPALTMGNPPGQREKLLFFCPGGRPHRFECGRS